MNLTIARGNIGWDHREDKTPFFRNIPFIEAFQSNRVFRETAMCDLRYLIIMKTTTVMWKASSFGMLVHQIYLCVALET